MRVQFYSTIKPAQREVAFATLFALLFGVIPNSTVGALHWFRAQTGNVSPQAAPAQTIDKNAQELKVRDSLNSLLNSARKRAEEYNTLFRDLATEEKRTSILFKKSGEEAERREVV